MGQEHSFLPCVLYGTEKETAMNEPHALTRMEFRDGSWQPVIRRGVLYHGIIYAENVHEGIALDEPDPDDVYGVWPMTPEDHAHGRGESKIRATKPEFILLLHASGCKFVLEDTRWTTGSVRSPEGVYVAVQLKLSGEFYVPDLSQGGMKLAASERAAAEQCLGGAHLPGVGFGVWKVPYARSASSCVRRDPAGALYVVNEDGVLETRPQEIIDRLVRPLEQSEPF